MQWYLLSCPTCTPFAHNGLSEIICPCLFYCCQKLSVPNCYIYLLCYKYIYYVQRHIYIQLITENVHCRGVFTWADVSISSGQPVRADVSLGRDVCRQLIILTSNNSPQSKVTTLIYAPLHTSCHRVNQTIEMHVLIKTVQKHWCFNYFCSGLLS